MKTALIMYEGMADRPDESLQQRTPMEVARCPEATRLAVQGRGGMLSAYRNREDQRSEAMLGRGIGIPDAILKDVWRGPLEALAADVDTEGAAWVFRADLVTLDGPQLIGADVPGVTREETGELVESLHGVSDELNMQLHVIAPGRVAVVVHDAKLEGLRSTAPFEVEGSEWAAAWPKNRRHQWLRSFVEKSHQILSRHSVNDVRVDLGENPANALWPWGGGCPLTANSGAAGVDVDQQVLISNGLLARGFANYTGIDMVELSNPWIQVDGKRQPFRIAGLVKALHERDHIVAHLEARKPGGRYGTPADKVWALECADHVILAPLLEVLEAVKPSRVALTVDGAVSARSGKWLKGPLPVILSGDGIEPDGVGHWDEVCCAKGSLGGMEVADLLVSLRKE